MTERCSDISPVSSLRILVGILFDPADFLGLKFKIIWIISSIVQGEMKNESWLDTVANRRFKAVQGSNKSKDRKVDLIYIDI